MTKISELGAAAALDGAELVPVVQDAATVRTTAQDIADLAQSGSTVAVVGATRTAGNLSLTSTSWTDVDTGLDLVIAAATGDWLEVSINGRLTTGASNTDFDIATIVSAAPVNYFGSGTGINALRTAAAQDSPLVGSFLYQVQAGDISGGNVTLRLRYSHDGAATRTFVAGASNAFKWWVKNYG